MKTYRVIDNGELALLTNDPVKALRKLNELLEKHDVTWCWSDEEELQ